MQIDAHQHFWRYDPAEYAWIDAAVLKRDYLPDDLDAARQGTGIEGSVAVQARTSLEETDWLLGLAASHAAIRGVVGWAPLKAEGLEALLERPLRELESPLLGLLIGIANDEVVH